MASILSVTASRAVAQQLPPWSEYGIILGPEQSLWTVKSPIQVLCIYDSQARKTIYPVLSQFLMILIFLDALASLDFSLVSK